MCNGFANLILICSFNILFVQKKKKNNHWFTTFKYLRPMSANKTTKTYYCTAKAYYFSHCLNFDFAPHHCY